MSCGRAFLWKAGGPVVGDKKSWDKKMFRQENRQALTILLSDHLSAP